MINNTIRSSRFREVIGKSHHLPYGKKLFSEDEKVKITNGDQYHKSNLKWDQVFREISVI